MEIAISRSPEAVNLMQSAQLSELWLVATFLNTVYCVMQANYNQSSHVTVMVRHTIMCPLIWC